MVPITAVLLQGLVAVIPLATEEVDFVNSGPLIPLLSSCEQFWSDSGSVIVS